MTYSQKLRDPRWQKKRLQILERDQWTCQSCRSTTKNLQVHHLVYAKRDPWDYADDCYQTLCEDCHEVRQELSDKAANAVKLSMRNIPTDRMEYFLQEIIGRVLRCDPYRQSIVNTLHESLDNSKAGKGVIEDGLFSDAVPALLECQIIDGEKSRAINLLKAVVRKLEGKNE